MALTHLEAPLAPAVGVLRIALGRDGCLQLAAALGRGGFGSALAHTLVLTVTAVCCSATRRRGETNTES